MAELISILDRRRLIFRQLRSLSRNDKAEGAIPEDLYQARPLFARGPSEARLRGLRANIDLGYCTYVQCWHKATEENSAFWRIYAHRGVALQSAISELTVHNFWRQASLRGNDIVYADTWAQARVQGLDVPSGITPNQSCMRRKRRAFSWETEWRVFLKPPTARYGALDARLPRDQYEIAREQWQMKWPEYEEISIDSVHWIARVVVAPGSPEWAFEAIDSVCRRNDVRCERSPI